MIDRMSPTYRMELTQKIANTIADKFGNESDAIGRYLKFWHEPGDINGYGKNFDLIIDELYEIELINTLDSSDNDTLIKIAIDLGINTPDYIPSIANFMESLKVDFNQARVTFDKAYKKVEEEPEIAVGLANSALESIIKEILKDERISEEYKEGDTINKLAPKILKAFKLFPSSNLPSEIKTMGSSLLAVSNAIEGLRSNKTYFHGKTNGDYIIEDPMYSYFIVNSVTTVGLFLLSFYKEKYPLIVKEVDEVNIDDLPF